METLFKALADENRRRILDALRELDGQTLVQLGSVLPHMTRFGVMKHIKVLEDALLITSEKIGRFKYHYLNPLPIHEVLNRWIAPFLKPLTDNLLSIKKLAEGEIAMSQNRPLHRFVTIIQAPVEKVWQAITDPKVTKQYFFSTEVVSEFVVDAAISYRSPDGNNAIEGKILVIEAGKRLVHTFAKEWDDENSEPASRVTYELEAMGSATKLTLIHDNFHAETKTFNEVGSGWPIIFSGMKTLLETGRPLEM